MRVGLGFDVHRFDPARPLVLGGVTIPGAPGLAGHSDADVLSHAVADAMLGAVGLGDLGSHFPDSDQRWKDASSLDLLAEVCRLAGRERFAPVSVDATVMLETPRLAPFREEMCRNLKRVLRAGHVSVKATTAEGLGPIGRSEGAACAAVVLLERSRWRSLRIRLG